MELMSFYAIASLAGCAAFVVRAHGASLPATVEVEGTTAPSKRLHALTPVTTSMTRDRRYAIATPDVASVLGGRRD